MQKRHGFGHRHRFSRRNFLCLGSGLVAAFLLPDAIAKSTPALPPERSLAFYNTHTGESLKTVYWADGDYLMQGMGEINSILRDHRANETHPIDRDLLDLLFVLRSRVNGNSPFHVISGYRSPATNASLRKNSTGVAKRSYHMLGKAIDIRMPGCDLTRLHKAALALHAGGVGSYPSSDFIHVDVGPVRRW